MIKEATKYVGIPYKKGGKTRQGLGCFGLVELFFLEHFKIHLLIEDGFLSNENHFKEVAINFKDIRDLDILNFKIPRCLKGGHLYHCGVFIKDYIFHSQIPNGVSLEWFINYYHNRHLFKIYRLKNESNTSQDNS